MSQREMHGDEQRQFQVRQEPDVERNVNLKQNGDQRNDDQPDDSQTFGFFLPRRARKQALCVLGHWPGGRDGVEVGGLIGAGLSGLVEAGGVTSLGSASAGSVTRI